MSDPETASADPEAGLARERPSALLLQALASRDAEQLAAGHYLLTHPPGELTPTLTVADFRTIWHAAWETATLRAFQDLSRCEAPDA